MLLVSHCLVAGHGPLLCSVFITFQMPSSPFHSKPTVSLQKINSLAAHLAKFLLYNCFFISVVYVNLCSFSSEYVRDRLSRSAFVFSSLFSIIIYLL